MPEIIVTTGASGYQHEDDVMLRERVSSNDFESERFGANLLERLGWAVSDATEAEQHRPVDQPDVLDRPEQRDAPQGLVSPEPDQQVDRPWEPVGIA